MDFGGCVGVWVSGLPLGYWRRCGRPTYEPPVPRHTVVEFYFNRLSIAADKSLSEGSGLNGSLTTAPSLQPGWQ